MCTALQEKQLEFEARLIEFSKSELVCLLVLHSTVTHIL